ncbi:MAG: hypothetical protein OES12_12325, partial [Anaerolineae bacterium]|nr:hypothetical protein [Anaerolineae bacterium]
MTHSFILKSEMQPDQTQDKSGDDISMFDPARLSCQFLDFQLRTPLVLASGIIGTSATLMARAA